YTRTPSLADASCSDRPESPAILFLRAPPPSRGSTSPGRLRQRGAPGSRTRPGAGLLPAQARLGSPKVARRRAKRFGPVVERRGADAEAGDRRLAERDAVG